MRFPHLPGLCSIKGRPVARQVVIASHRATNPARHAVANPQAVAPHTDIIAKSSSNIQYGHEVNLATEQHGLITYFNIENGNPSDATLYRPVLDACQADYPSTPESVVADGGYASHDHVCQARQRGVKRAVFNKPSGLGLREMGMKEKTFAALRNFRSGVEGNISELKRVFGLDRTRWKGQQGFNAYVWSSALTPTRQVVGETVCYTASGLNIHTQSFR